VAAAGEEAAAGAAGSAFALEGVETTGCEEGVLPEILAIGDMVSFVKLWHLPYHSISAIWPKT
jgi:hypothetical protein